jgi:hypothetical protein
MFCFVGVVSVLDAATNDLAQLINNFDLEATPSTPDMTPLKPFPHNNKEGGEYNEEESPTKGTPPHALTDSPLKRSKTLLHDVSSELVQAVCAVAEEHCCEYGW